MVAGSRPIIQSMETRCVRERRRPRALLVVLSVLIAGVLSACGSAGGTASTTTTAVSRHAAKAHRHHRAPERRRVHHSPGPKRSSRPAPIGAIVASAASGSIVQSQPSPGSCHARGSGLYSLPDSSCTPGATNPDVTQATIGQTICVSGWTSTVRPSESITEAEKRASMAAYGDGGSMGDYEYDHLISLELGGAVNDSRNLWPEPGASPNPKDSVENALHAMVCDRQIALAQAQRIIATNWISWARSHALGATSLPPSRGRTVAVPPTSSASPGPNKPIADVNCSDFATHAAAQQWFTQHGGSASNDVAGLDGNHDGIACSSLP